MPIKTDSTKLGSKNVRYSLLLGLYLSLMFFTSQAQACVYKHNSQSPYVAMRESHSVGLSEVLEKIAPSSRDDIIEITEERLDYLREPGIYLEDLISALEFVYQVEGQAAPEYLVYGLVDVFTSTSWRERLYGGDVGSNRYKSRSYLLNRYNDYKDLINIFVGEFKSYYFFAPCPSDTPYFSFYKLAAQHEGSEVEEISVSDVLDKVNVGNRSEDEVVQKRNYYYSPPSSPLVRFFFRSCSSDKNDPVVVDFAFDVDKKEWIEVSLPLNPYQWYENGVSELDIGNTPRQEIGVSYEEYNKMSSINENDFIEALMADGISTELPDVTKWECN